MKGSSLSLIAAVFWGMTLASAPVLASTDDPSEISRSVLHQHAVEVMRLRPLSATRIGLTDADVGVRIDDAMDQYSAKNLAQWRTAVRQMRRELLALEPGQVDPLTRRALEEIYQVYLGESSIPFGYVDSYGRHRPYVVNQIDQPLQEVPHIMVTFQRVDDAEAAADYLGRLWAYPDLALGVMEKFNRDADAGWLPPRPLIEGALRFIDGFTEPPAEDHELVTALYDKLHASNAFSADERDRIINEAIVLVASKVYPSYQTAARMIRDRLPEADDAAGIWARPLGDKFYRHTIRNEASSDRSPEEIHRIGLAEVERILVEMDAGLMAQGYREGSVGERMIALASEPRFLYQDSSAGREKLIGDLNELVVSMQAKLPEAFGKLPVQGVEIRPVPAAREAGATGGFYDGPPVNGSRPGIFWINLRDMAALPWFSLPTLTYHETLPGHHLEIALARARMQRPLLWRFAYNAAYSEGWALYAEKLAAELGAYKSDPLADLGRLQAELYRSVRLVVDTGMHYKRWTREKAIQYMRETIGWGEKEVTAEIERYMAWPGQALAYKLGMLEILDMRSGARKALGESFELKGFHDRLLEVGPVSMPLLRQQLDGWVAGQRATTPPYSP